MDINFVPSEELRKLHKVELDLLREFQRVCAKHQLKYYASGGTLLGAVRHQGFIPWDDDIDLQMMWDDFKKLMEIAPDEFQYPYFFQSYRTDVFGELSNAKLRRSDTTGCTKWEYDNVKSSDHNRGIFIDIFPLFSIPSSETVRFAQKNGIIAAWKAVRGWNALQNHNAGAPSVYDQYLPDYEKMKDQYSIQQIKQLYMDLCALENGDSEEIGETSFKTHNEKFIWPREWFRDTVELPFEDISIVCPKKFDEVLTKQYGDWRTPIYDGALHEMYIYDTETPFQQMKNLF